MYPNKILHPTDYTECSEPALRVAAGLAHDHKAGLVLLHVAETLGPEKLSFGEVASGPQPATYRSKLFEQLHKVRPPDSQIHVEYVLSEEDPVTAILRTAAIEQCDLIVMGTHGITGWRRWVLGSIAEEVVRRANCPVLVVKPLRPAEPLPSVHPNEMHPGYLIEKEDLESPPNDRS
jgi:nucleotide-binding universal stress UspA family protein